MLTNIIYKYTYSKFHILILYIYFHIFINNQLSHNLYYVLRNIKIQMYVVTLSFEKVKTLIKYNDKKFNFFFEKSCFFMTSNHVHKIFLKS